MTALRLTISADERDLVIAELWEAGTTGITEGPGEIRAFFADRETATKLAERFSKYDPELDEEDDSTDWIAVSRSGWEPIEVGQRFFLVPNWRDDPAPPGRIRLTTYPGMACGTGAHPATQICIEAMERYVKPGVAVIDVGTGSGILAAAAVMLGASPVFACDIDLSAIKVARTNFLDSKLDVQLYLGSLRSISQNTVAVVLANLNVATLLQLSADIHRITTNGSILIASGFRAEEIPALAKSFRMNILERLHRDGWAGLVLNAL